MRVAELLDILFRGLLFHDISEVRDSLKKKNGVLTIIKIAMDIELNTIIFYQKLKEIITSYDVKLALGKMLKEEEKHLIRLKSLRLKRDPAYAGIKYGKLV